jgi:hypothetical protein
VKIAGDDYRLKTLDTSVRWYDVVLYFARDQSLSQRLTFLKHRHASEDQHDKTQRTARMCTVFQLKSNN